MNGHKGWTAAICGLFLAISGTSVALADIVDVEAVERIETQASVSAGYRGTSTHGEPGRALEFDSLQSGPLFDVKLFTDRGRYHLDLGASYLNDNDFSADAKIDAKGLLKVDLHSERFFHNLDHIPYVNRPDASSNGIPRVDFTDQNPADRYGLRLDMSEAKLKVKYPDYPAHFNISYWRFEKNGERQLRFADENCAGACHMQSKTRKLDRVTDEVKAGIDAHLGFFDIVLESLFRTFRDREPVPVDAFASHSLPGLRDAGAYEHDEDPDSTLKELTLKLNTAPSGGFTASTSFTVGERENRSDLTSVAPVEATTDYYKAAADVTYTPSQTWTINLRYRLLDMDSDNNAVIHDNVDTINAFVSPVAVRPSMDITRAWYEAVAVYRPVSRFTLKAEARREDIDRSNTGTALTHNSNTTPITINPNWELPDEETITRVKLGFNSRLLEKSALKLSGWLALQRNDDPAYGASFENSRELFLAANYTPSTFWGLMANLNLKNQDNNDFESRGQERDREKEQQNVTLGTWVNPRDGLSFDLSYGYFRTAIDQDLRFGTGDAVFVPPFGPTHNYVIPDNNVEYRQAVHSVTAGMTWQALENLSCRVEAYHIGSKARFSPDFDAPDTFPYNIYGPEPAYAGNASSTELRDISKLDIRQNGVRGRVNWQIDEHLSCAVEAAFDDYDERGNDTFDGSVQRYMASLSYAF